MTVRTRVVVESGATYDDPSSDLLLKLLTEFEGHAHDFVILERPGDPAGQTYIQVAHENVSPWRYQLEYRDGAPDRHFQTFTGDVATVHRAFVGWAADKDGWSDGQVWTRLVLE